MCIDGFRFVGFRNDEKNTGKFFLADRIQWQISTSQKHRPEGVVFERKKLAKIEAKIVRAILGCENDPRVRSVSRQPSEQPNTTFGSTDVAALSFPLFGLNSEYEKRLLMAVATPKLKKNFAGQSRRAEPIVAGHSATPPGPFSAHQNGHRRTHTGD